MVFQLSENSAVSPVTLNGKPLTYDSQWRPLTVKGGRIMRLDDLAEEPSIQSLDETFGIEPDYDGRRGRCEQRQQIGRRAMACVEAGDYKRVLAILNPVMTPPLRRAISTGNPDSIKEQIARATGYKPF